MIFLLTMPGLGDAHEAVTMSAAGEAKVRKALDEKTQFDFIELPLAEVAQAIAERHHIEVQLARSALDEAGIAPDMAITRQVNGISLRAALRLMLDKQDMAYIVGDGYLLLTTKGRAAEAPSTRFYPVGDLVKADNGLRAPAPASGSSRRSDQDYKQLVDIVTFAVAPTTWGEVGGPGAIAAIRASSALAVSQTDDIHEDIAALLAALRLVRDNQIKAARAVVGFAGRQAAEHELRLSVFHLGNKPATPRGDRPRFGTGIFPAGEPAAPSTDDLPREADSARADTG